MIDNNKEEATMPNGHESVDLVESLCCCLDHFSFISSGHSLRKQDQQLWTNLMLTKKK